MYRSIVPNEIRYLDDHILQAKKVHSTLQRKHAFRRQAGKKTQS